MSLSSRLELDEDEGGRRAFKVRSGAEEVVGAQRGGLNARS